jgi:hypothetical protein
MKHGIFEQINLENKLHNQMRQNINLKKESIFE